MSSFHSNPELSNICATFGRGERCYLGVKTLAAREQLPNAVDKLFGDDERAQYIYNIALGDVGIWYAGYVDHKGQDRCAYACLPPKLREWIGPPENPQRHIPSLRVTLGDKGTFFAMDRRSFMYDKLPSEMNKFLDDEDFEYQTGGPRVVAFGPGTSYLLVLKNGSYAYDLIDFSKEVDDRFDQICGNRHHALDGLIYFSMSCYKAGAMSGMLRNQSGGYQRFGLVPDGWEETLESIVNPPVKVPVFKAPAVTVSTPSVVKAPAPRPTPAPARAQAPARPPVPAKLTAPQPARRAPSPAPYRPSNLAVPAQRPAQRRKSSSGLSTALLKGAISVGSALLKAEIRQANSGGGFNGGYSGGGGGGDGGGGYMDFSSGGNSMDMSSFWDPINSAAQDPIQ